MRVAIIIERFDTKLGGAERSICELADALAEQGLEVTILAAKGESNLENVKFLCKDVESKRVDLEIFGDAIKEHLKENEYDAIHSTLPFDFVNVYQPRGGCYAESAIANTTSYRSELIKKYKLLTMQFNFKRARLIKAERELCENCNVKIAALSKSVKGHFLKHYKMDESRIAVIPNAVNTVRLSENIEQKIESCAVRLGENIWKNKAVFLFAAHNFRLKGLRPLIEAFAVAAGKETSREPVLVVVGRGNTAKYEKLAAKLGILENVIFFGASGDVRALLALSNVAVLPTYYDPASRFVLEALAMGAAVITTKLNGSAEMFESNKHGITIDRPDDIEALAEAICYYCDEGNEQASQQVIIDDGLKDKISIEHHAKKLVELYESIL